MGGKRRTELSKVGIDRDWPYQVALPEYAFIGHLYRTLHYFIEREGLTLCPRGFSFQRNDMYHRVFCFAEKQHAERFQLKFGGEWIDPKTRPRWGKVRTGN